MRKIAIIETGIWGIALSRMLVNCGNAVSVWAALYSEIEGLNRTRRHRNLPNVDIPPNIIFFAR